MLHKISTVILISLFAFLFSSACSPDSSNPELDSKSDKDEQSSPEPKEKSVEEIEEEKRRSCEARGLVFTPFEKISKTSNYEEKVADFSFKTKGKVWKLSEQWTGCDNYVFINYMELNPQVGQGIFTDAYYKSVIDGSKEAFKNLFKNLPRNTYLIIGADSSKDTAKKFISGVKSVIGSLLEPSASLLTEEEQKYWGNRVLYSETPFSRLGGGLGKILRKKSTTYTYKRKPEDNTQTSKTRPMTPIVFSVTQDQVLKIAESAPNFVKGKYIDIEQVADLVKYYNYLFSLKQMMQKEDNSVREVVLFDRTFNYSRNSMEHFYPKAYEFDVDLPPAEELEEYDSLDLFFHTECGLLGQPECGEWDYDAHFYICDDKKEDGSCKCLLEMEVEKNGKKENICIKAAWQEIFRWITPYASAGVNEWLVEATPVLALLKKGGKQKFKFQMNWNINSGRYLLKARLKKSNKGLKPFAYHSLFRGGGLSSWQKKEFKLVNAPIQLTPPDDYKKVELAALVTGHADDGNKCGEWCIFKNTFKINDTEFTLDYTTDKYPMLGAVRGCADLVSQGVVPAQSGNWTPGRFIWCPGTPIRWQIIDVTDSIKSNSENTIEYKLSVNGNEDYTSNKDARVPVASYLIYYK